MGRLLRTLSQNSHPMAPLNSHNLPAMPPLTLPPQRTIFSSCTSPPWIAATACSTPWSRPDAAACSEGSSTRCSTAADSWACDEPGGASGGGAVAGSCSCSEVCCRCRCLGLSCPGEGVGELPTSWDSKLDRDCTVPYLGAGQAEAEPLGNRQTAACSHQGDRMHIERKGMDEWVLNLSPRAYICLLMDGCMLCVGAGSP